MTTILLVDDHSDIRRLIRLTLGKAYTVLEAGDGPAALEIAHRSRPDIIVLDIMLPGELDGLQLLDAIKSDSQLTNTRVIMVTAKGQDHEKCMERGADAFFVKPFSPLQLVTFIKETLPR